MKPAIVAAALVAMVVGLLGFATPAAAFCVYNDTQLVLNAAMEAGPLFKAFFQDVAPAKNTCCHWQNKDCNSRGTQQSPVTIRLELHRTLQ